MCCFNFRTGDGDPPENACLFWRKIRSKDLSESYLAHVEYALLGLGDTNYTTFLGYPKSLEKQLQKLGAKPIYSSGWADDAVGLETVVDPWIENLWPALENQKANPHHTLALLPLTVPETPNPAELTVIAPAQEVSQKEVEQPVVMEKLNEDLEKSLVDLASLKISVSPLSQCDLKVPVLPVPYLELKFNSQLMVSLFKFNLSYLGN